VIKVLTMLDEEPSKFSYPAELLPKNPRTDAILEQRKQLEKMRQDKLELLSKLTASHILIEFLQCNSYLGLNLAKTAERERRKRSQEEGT
jgi:hypothetical protein